MIQIHFCYMTRPGPCILNEVWCILSSGVIPWFYCSGNIREVKQFWETMLPKDTYRAHLHQQRAPSRIRSRTYFFHKINHGTLKLIIERRIDRKSLPQILMTECPLDSRLECINFTFIFMQSLSPDV